MIQISIQSSFIELRDVKEKRMDFLFIEMLLENQNFINIFCLTDDIDTKAEGILKKIIEHGSTASSKTYTLNSHDVKNTLNIILIDSLDHLPVNSILKSSKIHLVILTSEVLLEKDFQKCFQIFQKKNILNVYIAYYSEETVFVVTFNPFSYKNCYDSKPIIMNNLQNFKFHKKHLTNFYDCPLRVGGYINIPFMMCSNEKKRQMNSTCDFEEMTGRDVNLLKTLST